MPGDFLSRKCYFGSFLQRPPSLPPSLSLSLPSFLQIIFLVTLACRLVKTFARHLANAEIRRE